MKNAISKLPLVLALGLIALVGFGAVAHAQGAPSTDPNASWLDLLKPAYDAFAGGHYAYAAGLGLIAALALIKRYAGADSWVHSTAGGALLTLGLATAGALATGLAAPGAHLSLALFKSAFLVGVGAVGGFIVLTHLLVEPVLKPLAAKAPPWAQPLFALLFALLDHSDPAARAIAAAKKAGDDAVAAKPGQGVAAATGAPTELK